MQTGYLTVCNMGLFGDNAVSFWMEDLTGILERFPLLECPHKQDFFAIYSVEQAEGDIYIDNQKIKLEPQKVIVVRPRCISNININKAAKGKLICFTEDFFSLRYNNNILHHFSFLEREALPYIRLNDTQIARWETLQLFVDSEFKTKGKETGKVLRSYLNILLFELERLYNPLGTPKEHSLRQEKIQLFQKLIDQNFKEKKLPSDYAAILNVSPNYLNKMCKEETGLTAGDLIRKQIVLEAQRLLLYTTDTINEIADKLGFENVSYFVTFFKKQANVTPEQFRRTEK
ncbi:helix-turn-helix domain-containing protein [Flavobacterium supellecticarium]|uniref:Helix-turn-helix domain-containing protein n=2 Tax=Flavobacterium supellecticarium TaxID=2565924 RepID=A0A4V3W7S9_9FLAO|nr:helix-turn-helix domain-containing protein [Flavobacterium supellecticarium]